MIDICWSVCCSKAEVPCSVDLDGRIAHYIWWPTVCSQLRGGQEIGIPDHCYCTYISLKYFLVSTTDGPNELISWKPCSFGNWFHADCFSSFSSSVRNIANSCEPAKTSKHCKNSTFLNITSFLHNLIKYLIFITANTLFNRLRCV